MNPQIETALMNRLLALADDELILSHRNSEWIGHAPILEEDIALANIAQDELGHATVWYRLYCQLSNGNPDHLAFFRDAVDFRTVPLVEMPRGDWAFTMVRQYLFDAYELTLFTHLPESSYQPLAEAVVKIRNEEIYHYKHTNVWIKRLGLGTPESQRRTQAALDTLWPLAQQLFQPLPDEPILVVNGIMPDMAILHAQWLDVVQNHLVDSGLTVPRSELTAAEPHPRTNHTEHLTILLAEMQKVARLDVEANW